MVFETTFSNLNGNYNPGTGQFICPVDGFYQFSVALHRPAVSGIGGFLASITSVMGVILHWVRIGDL